MRLFVCTWLDPDNQAFYNRRMAELIASSGGLLRAIPKDSAHITYAFVAHADEDAIATIDAALGSIASSHVAIEIRLGAPAILFAGSEARLVLTPIIYGADATMKLGADIVAEIRRRLPDIYISGSHSPHVTLSRFRKHTRRGWARAVLKTLADEAIDYVARLDRIAEVHLVASELTAAGPRYVTLSWVPLGGGDR